MKKSVVKTLDRIVRILVEKMPQMTKIYNHRFDIINTAANVSNIRKCQNICGDCAESLNQVISSGA